MVGRFVCAEIVILLLCGVMGRIVLCPLRAWSARLGVPSGLAPWVVLVLLAPLPLAWPGPSFRAAMVTLLFVMSWKAASQDIDLGTEDTLWSERAFLLVSALLSFWNPVFLLANLWTQFSVFDAFKHHGTLPLRFLMIGCAICGQWTLMSALGFGGDSGAGPAHLGLLPRHGLRVAGAGKGATGASLVLLDAGQPTPLHHCLGLQLGVAAVSPGEGLDRDRESGCGPHRPFSDRRLRSRDDRAGGDRRPPGAAGGHGLGCHLPSDGVLHHRNPVLGMGVHGSGAVLDGPRSGSAGLGGLSSAPTCWCLRWP